MSNAASNWEDVYRTQTARIEELERENADLRGQLDILTNQFLKISAENIAHRMDVERIDFLICEEGQNWYKRQLRYLQAINRQTIDAARKEAQP